jgi:hypothetical protein
MQKIRDGARSQGESTRMRWGESKGIYREKRERVGRLARKWPK